MDNEQLPSPLVDSGVDLSDFPFMPLDVRRLRDSKLAVSADGECFRAAVLLWCASWHQIPAASIPDDDLELSQLAGFGRAVKEWKKIKEGALYGWIKCADGRLYHPVVAEKAVEAWKAKLQQRWRSECARIKKHCQRHELPVCVPDFDEWLSQGCPSGQPLSVPRDTPKKEQGQSSVVPRETSSKGQGEGQRQGQGQGISKPSEANASGGEPPAPEPAPVPLTPDEIIFTYGLPMLTNAGTAEKQARSFLGGLRKSHGDTALIDKLRECLKVKPVQPLEWLAAALPPSGSGKSSGKHSGFDSVDYRAGVTADGRF